MNVESGNGMGAYFDIHTTTYTKFSQIGYLIRDMCEIKGFFLFFLTYLMTMNIFNR